MESEQQELAHTAEGCWRARRDEIEGIGLWMPVYLKPLWTVRDVLIHCAFWNEEATNAVYAHIDGGSYVREAGAELDALNQLVVETSWRLSARQVDYEWVCAQNGFTEVLLSLDDAAMLRFITCPRGELKPVADMVVDELLHVQDHIDDVLAAVGAIAPSADEPW